MSKKGKKNHTEDIRHAVREAYGKIASSAKSSCCAPSTCGCGGSGNDSLAAKIGYSGQDLASLPPGADMGLSCGNPTAVAGLRPGETVLDLGSGGGFDVFIAAVKVGTSGRVIGVDMTPEMIEKARRNIPAFRERTGLDNVEFRLGEIEYLPLADSSVDVVISNCVINLSADKARVWKEVARVLKPGGRVAVSDLALLQPLPPEIAEMVEALVGCVAGAVLIGETRRMLEQAGLAGIKLNPDPAYLDAQGDFSDPLFRKIIGSLPKGAKVSDYLTSLSISARKS